MELSPISLVLPSGAWISSFMEPEPELEHTTKISCGCTRGEAVAAPSDSTNHANVRRMRIVKRRRDCIESALS